MEWLVRPRNETIKTTSSRQGVETQFPDEDSTPVNDLGYLLLSPFKDEEQVAVVRLVINFLRSGQRKELNPLVIRSTCFLIRQIGAYSSFLSQIDEVDQPLTLTDDEDGIVFDL